MTTRLYSFVIGNAWGKPEEMVGPEHYWCRTSGDDRGKWKSICGEHTIEADSEFGGVPSISLCHEHDPTKWNRCEKCFAIYMETNFGKRFNVLPPYTDGLEDEFEDGDVLD